MRLIDADALKDVLLSGIAGEVGLYADLTRQLLTAFVDEQPTIDAVPVVRCVYCKHYEEKGFGFGLCHLEKWGDGGDTYPFMPPSVSRYGFCKWADRREECD